MPDQKGVSQFRLERDLRFDMLRRVDANTRSLFRLERDLRFDMLFQEYWDTVVEVPA